MIETLRVGDLAYYETVANGLIPCRVLEITGTSGFRSTAQRILVQFTANRSAYKKGETIGCFGIHVFPRKSVHRRKYGTYVSQSRVEVG